MESGRQAADLFTDMDFTTQVLPTGGLPVVYAQAPGESDRTILLYNHYDVQPEDPIELWTSAPFEATERGGRIYGRGSSDDKGQLVSRIAALRAVWEVLGHFPCRVKVMVEGEEEIGSPNVESFIQEHQELLAADGCVWEFGGVNDEGRPESSGSTWPAVYRMRVQTLRLDLLRQRSQYAKRRWRSSERSQPSGRG
jgi:acetylornithine deacetylase/succinyl-diaminopimelate desuccinylase-like protein